METSSEPEVVVKKVILLTQSVSGISYPVGLLPEEQKTM